MLGTALCASLFSIYAIRKDNNSTLSQEVGQAISKFNRTEKLLHNIASIFKKRLDFDRGMILLAAENELVFQAGFGYTRQNLHLMKLTRFRLNRDHSQGVFVICFKEKKSFLINDLSEIQTSLSERSLSFARTLGTRSFICCPIVCDGESLGVLAVDNMDSHRHYRNPMSRKKAIKLMEEEADLHLDREIIEHFLVYLQRTEIGEEMSIESLA